MNFESELKLFENHLRLKGRGESTIAGYLRDTRAFLKHTGVESLTELNLSLVQEWDAAVAEHNKPATRARYRNAVRCFIEYGQVYLRVPDIGGEFTPIFVPTHDPKLPSREELLLILDAQRSDVPLEFRDCAVCAIFALTGVRRSEIRLLNMGDVFLDKSSFQIIATSPKGHGQRRMINFGDLSKAHDIAAAYFGKYYVQRLVTLGGSKNPRALNAPLFATLEQPLKPLAAKTFNDIVTNACRRVTDGVRNLEFVTPHTLRHFFATWCAANGMRIENIQHYLGHADISTTMRYIHLAEKVTGVQAREHGPMVGMKAARDLYLGNPEHQLNYFRTLIPQARA